MPPVRLTKHHALGNDFLVLLTDQRLPRLAWGELARRLCDRRHGIGADGLLVGALLDGDAGAGSSGSAADGTAGGDAALAMRLYNADGGEAEMSGNGIRCLVQAWAGRKGLDRGEVMVTTAAGPRIVAFEPGERRGSIVASADMGPVVDIDAPAAWPDVGTDHGRPVAHLSVGNPHTVVAVEDVRTVDLEQVGQQVPDVNLEVVESGPEPTAITMRVHERGAGVTEACGTGACAAAWAARRWGMVPRGTPEITVHMDGGDASVELDRPADGRVTLTGPATFVGTVEVEL